MRNVISPASSATDRTSGSVAIHPALAADRAMDALVRALASDFPLHSMNELRRTIMDAEDDLWPHQDSAKILGRARERLCSGLI